MILAVEELAKSLVFSAIGTGVEIPKSFKREVMKMHEAKYSIAFGVLFSRTVRTLVLNIMARAYRSGGSLEKALDKEIRLARSHSSQTASYRAELEWIADANEIKHRGLYVDFVGKDWKHPGTISKKDFVFGYRIAEQLIREKGRAVRKQLKTEFQADDTSKALMSEIVTKRPIEDRDELLRYWIELALK